MSISQELIDERIKVKQVRRELTDFCDTLTDALSNEHVIDNVMVMRQYTSEKMRKVLTGLGIFKLNSVADLLTICNPAKYSTFSEWGVLREDGYSLLVGRYVFPIRDFAGNVAALVGWAPCEPKYVMTPTYGFVKDAQFFGADQYMKYIQQGEDTVYLVEGFFDALSLRSEGFCAMSNFGLTLSAVKAGILQRFGKVVVISDADVAGRRPFPYVDGDDYDYARKKQWRIDNPVTFTQIKVAGVKDVDDLIRLYDCHDDIYALRSKGPVAFISEQGVQ